MTKRLLITGMSGAGKSSVIMELARRGYNTVDMDYDGWSETASDGEWVWREDRVRNLLAGAGNEPLFVCGAASNQWKFYPQFDAIILLSAPADVIKDRLATRTTNSFGKSAEELAKVLDDLEHIEPRLRRIANLEVTTEQALDEVVGAILTFVAGEA